MLQLLRSQIVNVAIKWNAAYLEPDFAQPDNISFVLPVAKGQQHVDATKHFVLLRVVTFLA
jgi:hypothetical protein